VAEWKDTKAVAGRPSGSSDVLACLVTFWT